MGIYTINQGKMWHIKSNFSGKTLGFRSTYKGALELIEQLTNY